MEIVAVRKNKKSSRAQRRAAKTVVVAPKGTLTVTPTKARRKRNKKKKAGPLTRGVQISDCAREYLWALSNPFHFLDNPEAQMPCVPSMPSRRTLKVLSFIRGSWSATAAGDACCGIMASPNLPANNMTGGGYYPAAILFSNASVGGQFTAYQSTFVGDTTSGANLNSMFASAQFANVLGAPGLQFRTVGFALRVRYIGTQLNMRGSLCTIQTPDHEDLQGQFGTNYRNYDQAMQFPVTKEWVTQTWSPCDSDEVDLQILTPVTATAGNPPPNAGQVSYPIGAIFTYSVGTENFAFEYEVVAIHEVCGRAARGATKTTTDPVGFEAILSSIDTVGKKAGTQFYNAILDKVGGYIAKQSGPAAYALGHAAANKFMNYAGNSFSGKTYAPIGGY
jgi:hypothetical protein